VSGPAQQAAAPEGWRYAVADGDGAAGPALLMLHGTGGDEREMLSLGRAMAPSAALLAPRGRVFENGMARYFSRRLSDPFAFPDLEERTDELAAFVRAARAEHGLQERPLVAVGYSNGANVATSLMLRHPGLLQGAALLRGLLPAAAPDGLDLSGTRVLVAAGRADGLVPAAMARRLAEALRAGGADVEERWSPGGHGLDAGDLGAVARWLEAGRPWRAPRARPRECPPQPARPTRRGPAAWRP
jgi:predicted esterase